MHSGNHRNIWNIKISQVQLTTVTMLHLVVILHGIFLYIKVPTWLYPSAHYSFRLCRYLVSNWWQADSIEHCSIISRIPNAWEPHVTFCNNAKMSKISSIHLLSSFSGVRYLAWKESNDVWWRKPPGWNALWPYRYHRRWLAIKISPTQIDDRHKQIWPFCNSLMTGRICHFPLANEAECQCQFQFQTQFYQ